MRVRDLLANLTTFLVLLTTGFGVAQVAPHEAPGDAQQITIFDLPRRTTRLLQLQPVITQFFAQQRYAEAERLCAQAVQLLPQEPSSLYNLACAQAQLGKVDDAFATLERAVAAGFRNPQHLQQDADLEPLRSDERWEALVQRAGEPAEDSESAVFWKRPARPAPIENRVAWVRPENTAWDPRNRVLRVLFQWPDELPSRGGARPVIEGHGRVGDLLRTWQTDDTAAGLSTVLYDNHDRDHSNFRYQQFPQLNRIEYSREAKQARVDNGLQEDMFFNAITFGNSSTALTQGPNWRSQPRLAYTDPRRSAILAAQYFSNHVYVYPEHRDHDPGHNGQGGYGDVYPANTPYLIISQGSSGSDRVFLDALACTLAAFRPEVRRRLSESGGLMPAVQMIFRRSNKPVRSDADYRSGIAHPTVFEGANLDVERMVELAHAMSLDRLPPVALIQVVEEEDPVPGRDYFDIGEREQLLTTPAAIARIARSTQYRRRIVVSAEPSRDLTGSKLDYHWVVLRGDPDAIQIEPQNPEGSVAEIHVDYHRRRPVRDGAKLESNRVDIGLFVSNGTYDSAPAFLSFTWPDNEERVYDGQQRIVEVTYSDPARGGNYVDPVIITPCAWTDKYHYDEQGQLLGWTRVREDWTQEFTADGARVTETDDLGRPSRAETVRYVIRNRPDGNRVLGQEQGNEVLIYSYESPEDRRGHVASRQPL